MDILSQIDSDTLSSYSKYDYTIILKENQKYHHFLFYKILPWELYAVKNYLDLHLAKKLIQTSSVSYFSLILFFKKPNRWTWFYIDYQKLNTITNKDWYLIALIRETFIELEGVKYFLKLICIRFFSK